VLLQRQRSALQNWVYIGVKNGATVLWKYLLVEFTLIQLSFHSNVPRLWLCRNHFFFCVLDQLLSNRYEKISTHDYIATSQVDMFT